MGGTRGNYSQIFYLWATEIHFHNKATTSKGIITDEVSTHQALLSLDCLRHPLTRNHASEHCRPPPDTHGKSFIPVQISENHLARTITVHHTPIAY